MVLSEMKKTGRNKENSETAFRKIISSKADAEGKIGQEPSSSLFFNLRPKIRT